MHVYSFFQSENSTMLFVKSLQDTNSPHQHAASVPIPMPHLPITATTKVSEASATSLMNIPESSSNPVSPSHVPEPLPLSQSTGNNKQPLPTPETPSQPGKREINLFIAYLHLSNQVLNLKLTHKELSKCNC